MTGTRSTATLLTAAEHAADTYVEQLRRALAAATTRGSATVDTVKADRVVRAAFDGWRPGSGEPIVDATRKVFAGHAEFVDSMGGTISEAVRRRTELSLWSVMSAADTVLATATFERQTELDTASADLQAARRELATRQADLEAAVNRGDVTAVLSLRNVVEVDLPGRIAELTSTVAAVEVEQAEHNRVPAARRAATVGKLVGDIRAELEATRARFAELESDLGAAVSVQVIADTALANADRAITTITADRDRYAAQHAQQQRASLRRLAGLADEPEMAPPQTIELVAPNAFGIRIGDSLTFGVTDDSNPDDPHDGQTPQPWPPPIKSAWHRTPTRAVTTTDTTSVA